MADDPLNGALVSAKVDGADRLVPARDIAKIATVERYAGTAYSLRPRNANTLILTSSSSAVAIVVPPASSLPVASGTRISVGQMGTGQVSFVAGPGVTIQTPETLNISKQYAVATLIATDVTDEWLLAGYLEAA